jgi:thioredoxin-like negative regulator of GroEL
MRSSLLGAGLLLAVAAGTTSARAELIWTEGGANQILAEAKARKLPVFLVFEAEWCGFCRRLEKETLTSPLVQKTPADYIAGRIDVDLPEGADAAKRWNVTGLPSLVILSSAGTLAASETGFRSDQQLALLLRDALARALPLDALITKAEDSGAEPRDLIAAARGLMDDQRAAEARPFLERALGLLPPRSAELARAHILLSNIASQGPGAEAALAQLDRAIASTDDPEALREAWSLKISALRTLGNREALIAAWKDYARALPKDATVQEDCVRALDGLDADPPVLLEQAGRALAVNPESPFVFGARARALYRTGPANDAEALTEINRAIELDPKETSWRVLRLKILDRLQSGAKHRSTPAAHAGAK